ncbi:chemotaxis protein CheC [Geothermobacter ehrlichii]|uniref:Chemotaxis protein CheC n=1 Tax=Geothermobacter ehrlichii TaxID=213224 RepID=A0A5D3WI87_9BACT|nr:chemotaxis protein CheC [Geothermobacter ehrlichii]TYO98151.1 chemotaxis protein CheC [Geothermobacter ehrlichii]
MDFGRLAERQKDILRELSNIGVGHAATALSQMVGQPVMLEVPDVAVIDLAEVPDFIGGPEQLVAGVVFRLEGEASGHLLLILSEPSADRLLQLLFADDRHAIDSDMGSSALMELGNIIASSYLSVLGGMLKLDLRPSVPFMAHDMAGAVVDQVLGELGRHGDLALVLETRFTSSDRQRDVRGHLFLLPDPGTLDVLLRAAGGDA